MSLPATLPAPLSQTQPYQWDSGSDSNLPPNQFYPCSNGSDLNDSINDNDQLLDNTNLLKLSDSLQNEFRLNPEIAFNTAQRVYDHQKLLFDGEATTVPPSLLLPYTCVLTRRRLHFLRKRVGAGTFTDVFQATVITTVRHEVGQEKFSPSNPKVMAIKRKKGRTTFSPEKAQLERATNGKIGIDDFLDTFKEKRTDNKYRGYSLNRLYDNCLSRAPFHQMKNPVTSLLTTLISSAAGLKNIHEKGFVHRDIKGGNILVSIEQESNPDSPPLSTRLIANRNTKDGVITDFDFLTPVPSTPHFTSGTPEYLDPSQFGTEEMCVYNQRIRSGMQTPAGDVFALGVTIEKDILKKFIKNISTKTSVETTVVPLIKSIDPKIETKNFTEKEKVAFTKEELKAIGRESKFRVIHYGIDIQKRSEHLMHRPQLDLVRGTLKEACSLLEEILSTEEINVLSQLADLSCRMQEVDLTVRPTIQQVHEELTHLLNCLQPSSVVQKRSREDNESESSQQGSAKRRRKQEDKENESANEEETHESVPVVNPPRIIRRKLFSQEDE